MEEKMQWQCSKCGNQTCDIGEMRVSGGGLSSIFDIENKAFTTVTCQQCMFTELYRVERGRLGQIFDFLTT
jgi:hypothetical protein